jgi:hypothetical protein
MCHVVIRPGPQDRDRVAEAINEADNGWRRDAVPRNADDQSLSSGLDPE